MVPSSWSWLSTHTICLSRACVFLVKFFLACSSPRTRADICISFWMLNAFNISTSKPPILLSFLSLRFSFSGDADIAIFKTNMQIPLPSMKKVWKAIAFIFDWNLCSTSLLCLRWSEPDGKANVIELISLVCDEVTFAHPRWNCIQCGEKICTCKILYFWSRKKVSRSPNYTLAHCNLQKYFKY